jgi:cellulose synthase/poly-beta-1,6-N-acetylglucosamine synthase-like glycosyltransferase
MSRLSQFVFWISLAALLYVYVGYPLLLAAISLFFKKKRSREFTPFLSILIAAYNEESGIRRKLEQTLQLDYPNDKFEIIVLSDGSTDRTDSIVESFGDSRIRLLRLTGRNGKTNAQNAGAKIARGDVIVFSDATTLYDSQALRRLASTYAEPQVGAASGRYLYFDPQKKSPTGLGTVAFWNYENVIKFLQSKISTISGCCGCIYSVRRELYTPLEPDVISDLVQPLHVIRQGYQVVFEDKALAYEETTQSTAEEFSMRVRVVTRGMRGLLSVPELLKPWRHAWTSFQLWSHKILRWFVPVFLLTLLAANTMLWERPGYQFFLVMQIAFYAVALVSLLVPLQRVWKPAGIPLYFCTLNAAAFLSLIEVARGKKYVVWETVRT